MQEYPKGQFGVMFHHFHDHLHIKGQGSISQMEFDEMLYYLKGKYNLLSSEDWYKRAVSNSLEQTDICLTFDDNLKCQYDIALPILNKHKIKAFWFIYTSPLEGRLEKLEIYRYIRMKYFSDINDFYDYFFNHVSDSQYDQVVKEGLSGFDAGNYLIKYPFYTVEDKKFRFIRDKVLGTQAYDEIMGGIICKLSVNLSELHELLWMSEAHIKQLDNEGHTIGLHSHTHPTSMASLDRSIQEAEYQTNYTILDNILGKKPFSISYPCGSYDNNSLDIMSDIGVNIGFGSNIFNEKNSLLEFPREDHSNIMRIMQNENNSVYK